MSDEAKYIHPTLRRHLSSLTDVAWSNAGRPILTPEARIYLAMGERLHAHCDACIEANGDGACPDPAMCPRHFLMVMYDEECAR